MNILKMSKKEILALSYNEFSQCVESLSSEEIIDLSKVIGYPVFTRKCMGN